MDQKLRTERRKLADLKAAEYNPRKALTPDDAEYQKIRRSIEEFGYVDPIIINEDGTIIGGHQRATVLKDLGYQEVDVVVVALDKQREKALNIALNKISTRMDAEAECRYRPCSKVRGNQRSIHLRMHPRYRHRRSNQVHRLQ